MKLFSGKRLEQAVDHWVLAGICLLTKSFWKKLEWGSLRSVLIGTLVVGLIISLLPCHYHSQLGTQQFSLVTWAELRATRASVRVRLFNPWGTLGESQLRLKNCLVWCIDSVENVCSVYCRSFRCLADNAIHLYSPSVTLAASYKLMYLWYLLPCSCRPVLKHGPRSLTHARVIEFC